jgi:alginate O-acetyltransferase complex protein AlgI
LEASALTTGYAWLGIVCYALQIYFDFSGYSDMALGLGRMLGFEFLENFNFPYISRSITEFWRRWHISLSNWMREYLYIPLGGNRLSIGRTYLNLWIVFFLSGLWHGAAWNFIFWGLYHGAFLVMDRVFLLKLSERLPRVVSVAFTFLIVLVGWVFFRAETLSQALEYLARMFWLSSPTQLLRVYPADIIHNRGIATLIITVAGTLLPLLIKPEQICAAVYGTGTVASHVAALFAAIVFVLSALALSGIAFSPFLYFRF